MAVVTWKRQRIVRARDPYAGRVAIHVSTCYDFVVSLRALFNPRTFVSHRSWATTTRAILPPDLLELGRFFFQGFETGLGYGAIRLVPHLPAEATPNQLIEAIEATQPGVLAGYMLDTGEISRTTLDVFDRAVRGAATDAEIEVAFRGASPLWAKRCRRVITDPEGAKQDLLRLLDGYRVASFEAEVPKLQMPLAAAAQRATGLLSVLRTAEAVEQLLGGYTLSEDLDLDAITLAPSIFIYPFMSSRVDERTREAVIVFGVRPDGIAAHEPLPADEELLAVLKSLADAGRLKALRRIADRPMYGPELVKELGLTQPTVHHHVSQLRAAGLVRQERTARGMLYSIRRESAEALLLSLRRLLALGEDRPAVSSNGTRRRRSR